MLPLKSADPEIGRQIALVATDIDGTLTRLGQLPPETLLAFERLQQAGIAVVLVTGRSAGWASALAHYLPVAAVIAENGAGFYPGGPDGEWVPFVALAPDHRAQLAACFAHLQAHYPALVASTDNPYRLSDWTFPVAGITAEGLVHLRSLCAQRGFGFIWSAVQAHIKPTGCDKGAALRSLLSQCFAGITAGQVLTVGDSANDADLFAPSFGLSVGVANLLAHRDQMPCLPRYLATLSESEGFVELVGWLLACRRADADPRTCLP